MKKLKYLLLAILLSVFAISCSKGTNQNNAPGYSENNGVVNGGALGDNNIVIPEGHKIIYTVYYDIKVEGALAPTIKTINSKVYELGGNVSTSKETLSNASYVYKVPSDKLNEFLDSVDGTDGVSSKSIESEDVTSSYNELEAEIEVLEATRSAYLKMLENEKLSLNEAITLNDKIVSIDKQLKSLYKNLDSFNSRIDYATITINYQLKYTPQPEIFLGDYGQYLVNLGKGIVEFLAYSAPFIVVAGLGVGVVFIVKQKKKNKNK